jgi:hypothetical protein
MGSIGDIVLQRKYSITTVIRRYAILLTILAAAGACAKKPTATSAATTFRWPERVAYRIDYVSTVDRNGQEMVKFAETKTLRLMMREGRFLAAFDSVLKTSQRPGQALKLVPFRVEDTLLFYVRLGPHGEISDVSPGCDPVVPACKGALPSSMQLEIRRLIPRIPEADTGHAGTIDSMTFDEANRPGGMRGMQVVAWSAARDTVIRGRVYSLIGWRSMRRSFAPGEEGRADLGAQQPVQEDGITLIDKQRMVPAYSTWAGAVPAPADLRAVGATGSGFRGRAYLAGSVFDSLYSREMSP